MKTNKYIFVIVLLFVMPVFGYLCYRQLPNSKTSLVVNRQNIQPIKSAALSVLSEIDYAKVVVEDIMPA